MTCVREFEANDMYVLRLEIERYARDYGYEVADVSLTYNSNSGEYAALCVFGK